MAETESVPESPVPGGGATMALPPGPGLAREAAAAYLRELLLRPGRTRRKWEQYAERNRPGQINQMAVAEVLARYLWDYPRRPGDTEILPRQLKDTASRALSGKLLSKAALGLFIEAFGIPLFERDQLWKLWEGSSRIRVLTGPRSFGVRARAEIETALGPAVHRTLSVHDHHYVGADGLPNRTRTLQVIEALDDNVGQIPYIYNTDALTIDLIQGCTGLGARLTEITSGFFATDMLLARPLGRPRRDADPGVRHQLHLQARPGRADDRRSVPVPPRRPAPDGERGYPRRVRAGHAAAECLVGQLERCRRRDHQSGKCRAGQPEFGAAVPALHRRHGGRLPLGVVGPTGGARGPRPACLRISPAGGPACAQAVMSSRPR